jgi:hypothetical protein
MASPGRRWNEKVIYSQHSVIQESILSYHFRRIAMNRKILALLGMLVLVSLLISACQPAAPEAPAETEGPAETEAPAGETKSVCLVQIDRSHPFHLGEEAGAQEGLALWF